MTAEVFAGICLGAAAVGMLWGWEVFYITGVSFECFQMF